MRLWPLLLSILLVDRTEESGIVFENVSGGADKRFIYETLGAGGAFVDYDGDGDLDVYLVTGAETLTSPGPPNRLFRNEGGGRFRDVTAPSGTGDTGFGVAVAAADVDRDGNVDLFVANHGADVLFLNRGDGTFERALVGESALDIAGGAAFGDYDGDGWPDLYVSSYLEATAFAEGGKGTERCSWRGLQVGCGPRGLPAAADRLYHNEEGRLQEVSAPSGIHAPEPSYGLGVLFQDLTGDGLPDVYVANDSRPNFLFVNQSDGTFVEEGLTRGLAYSGEGLEQAGMGVDAGDVDGDGDDDVVVTNFSHDHTTLYENSRRGFFSDASYKVGLGKPTYFPLSWGVRFVDLDADTDLDLVIAHGHIYPGLDRGVPETSYAEPNQIYENDGTGRFDPLESVSLPRRSSRGLASGDYDDDGRIDLLVTNIDAAPELLHNETASGGGAILVKLVGESASREGLGARVTVSTAKDRFHREVASAGSYASAQDPRVHFGLGGLQADWLEVRWPSGEKDRFPAPTTHSLLVVKEGVGLLASFPLELFRRGAAGALRANAREASATPPTRGSEANAGACARPALAARESRPP